jgi:lipopolysaccharide transport system ATP-binding protein
VDADILVIDEALAVGDVFFTQKCMRFLRNFMKKGTILFVSHDTASIRSLCETAVWLEKGVVQEKGLSKNISEKYLEAFYEVQQGKGTTTRVKTQSSDAPPIPARDPRLDLLNDSNLRNDIQLVELDLDGPSFGLGGAQISSVKLIDAAGNPLSWIVGGEQVTLCIEAIAVFDLESPIIGFFIKDRLGQCLFGDNTYLSYMDSPILFAAGEIIEAKFTFDMPRLSPGNYSITVAVASGTQEEHIQHHWIHDAVSFKSEVSSTVAGILGIPMGKINLSLKAR